MADLRLGKAPARYDERTLKLARYADVLPEPPASSDRREGVTFGMFGNDRAGDCTCAAMGNARRLWAHLTGRPQPVTDADVLAAYEAITGYNPATGTGDTGAVELDVLNYWRTEGFAGEKIDGYAAVNLHDQRLVVGAMWVFDGLYIGVQLPATAQAQLAAGEPWTVDTAAGSQAYPGSWGGHAVFAVDWDPQYVYLATWGAIQPATWEWWHTYVDEAYAVLDTPEQFRADGRTAEGFDLEQLRTDLAAL